MAYSSNSKGIQMSVADEEFVCPLCCEIFEEPKVLPKCAHSFCKGCLRELIIYSFDSFNVSCPVCRKTSNIPRKGVEELATNTLLVRLIDNIPGRKERAMILDGLTRCKEEITKNKEAQTDLEKKISQTQGSKEKGLKLKREINEHVQKAIESLKHWEQDCYKKVDLHLSQHCGLGIYKQLEEERNQRRNYADDAAACIQSAEEMLNRNEISEILEMKDIMVAQLKEYSTLPKSSLFQEMGHIKDFDMELQKVEVKQDIGKVVKRSGQKHVTFSAEYDQIFGQPVNLPLKSTSMKSSRYSSKLLEFEPFCMAVCPCSGDVALLWEERRQVYIYNSELEFQRKFSIMYGDLWDVCFTNDGKIIVVNRSHNRLLLYNTKGRFVNFEVKKPQYSVKFTYVSFDIEERFIVTSTKVDSDDDKDVLTIPCIMVYNSKQVHVFKEPCLVFGKTQLVEPVSRAIFLNNKFYIADECESAFFIKVFSELGQFIKTFNLQNTFLSFTTNLFVQNSSDLIVVHTDDDDDDASCINTYYIKDEAIVNFEKMSLPLGGLKQALVISGRPDGPVQQLEIYEEIKSVYKVNYGAS